MEKSNRHHSISEWLYPILTALILIFLYAPVVVMIIFSFNNSRANVTWSSFTLDYYRKLFTDLDMWEVFLDTIVVAGVSTVLATMIGTTGAVGFRNAKFPGKKLISTSVYFPLIIPEIVIAAAMLMLFNVAGVPLSIYTVIIGNTTLALPYVFINVRARLAGMDSSMEEASMDLGAGRFYTFFHVTLPAIMPGVYAGAFMSFSLTIDELIITSFLADARTTTLPVKVYSMLRRGISPEINALTTIILLLSFVAVGIYVLSILSSRRRNKKLAVAAPEIRDSLEEKMRANGRIRLGVSFAVLAVLIGIAACQVNSLKKYGGSGSAGSSGSGGAGGSVVPGGTEGSSGAGSSAGGSAAGGSGTGGSATGGSASGESAEKIDYGTDSLNILVWSGFWSEDVFDDYERETGVKVNVSYIDNTDILLAKLLEGSADYDVIDLEIGYVESFIRNGLLAKIDKNNVLNLHNIEDQYFTKTGAPIGDEKEEYVVPDMAPLYTTIVYNKDTVPFVPKSLEDFADPRFKGQVAMVNSTISLYGGALSCLGYSPDSIDPDEMKAAHELLLKIKPNVKAFVGESAAAQLKSGEVSAAYCWDFNVLCAESEENWEKFVFQPPKGGCEYAPQYWAIPASTKHKRAAEAFIDFECRPEESSKNLIEFGGAPIIKRELIGKYLPDNYYDSPVFEANASAFPGSWKIAIRDEQIALMDKYYTELMTGVESVDE